MPQEKLILSLLKGHIIFSRLNLGLSAIGLNTEEFGIGLAGTVFNLMGFGDDALSDGIFDQFLSVIARISTFAADEWVSEVEPLAIEAYALLLSWKQPLLITQY